VPLPVLLPVPLPVLLLVLVPLPVLLPAYSLEQRPGALRG
jgi:hypothetical protein